MDRVPPQNIDAERAVLGAMLMVDPVSKVAIADCIRILNREDCFYREAHRKIFDAIKFLFSDDQGVDLLTVSRRLEEQGLLERVGGVPYMNEMIDSSPSAANAAHYADMVKDEADRRRIIYVTAEANNLAFSEEDIVDEILANAIDSLLKVQLDVTEAPKKFGQTLKNVLKVMQERSEDPNKIVGVPCGIRDIDVKTGGFVGGDVIVLAARPGMGKSTWIQNMAQFLCEDEDYRASVLLFSMEMKAEQIVAKMLASESKIPFTRFRSGTIGESEWRGITLAAGRMDKWKLQIHDEPAMTLIDMRTEIMRETAEHGKPDVVMADYLQLMEPVEKSRNRETDVSGISRGLKKLSMSLDIPFVVVSQLNRQPENRPDKRPQMSDLRESGAIEQDADTVCFLYRDDYHDRTLAPGPCEFIIAKQRMGPTGTVKIHFEKKEARFYQAHHGNTGRRTFREQES